MNAQKAIKKLEIGIAEFLIFIILVLSILDALEIIPAEFDYIKKIISWVGLGYLFYKASITKIILGDRHKHIDWILVCSYFLFMFKDFIGFMISAFEESAGSFMGSFYYFMIINRHFLEAFMFYTAGIMIILLAIYFVHLPVKKGGVMHLVHEDKKAKDVLHKILRFVIVYLALMGFYFIVFNLIMEWLAIAIDAVLVVVAFVFYLYLVAKHKKKLTNKAFLYKTAAGVENFYHKFLNMFTKKRTVGLAITGLLVLHIFTDVANFLIPYVLGIHDVLYFEQFGPGHAPIWWHMIKDMGLVGGWSKIGVFGVYLLNTIAMFMLFLGPGYIWWHLYKKKRDEWKGHRNWYWVFFGALTMLLISPVFRITRFDMRYLIGVDIQTHQMAFVSSTGWAVLVSVLVMAIFYILSLRNLQRVAKLAFLVVQGFFGLYIYHFFRDTAQYYITGVIVLLQNFKLFLGMHLFVFLMITILFYVIGFMIFIYECHEKEFKRMFKR